MNTRRRRWRWARYAALGAAAVASFSYTATLPHSGPAAPRRPAASPSAPATASDPNVAGGGCDASFERYTYHPARLVRLKDCVTVTGTVVVIRHEADGDLHVQFRLDPAFAGLMNAANLDPANRITGGYFIIEPDCVGGPVTQADAQASCAGAVPPAGFANLVPGAHLSVSGPWVTDVQHGHNEIHPIERLAPA